MPNKELGIADPVYDALRIRSGQSIAPDLGGGTTGGSGLENKIYVWHADGSSIDTFDPDAAGLALAIAAAATGDTIWLPSIPIALTAAITIPANVALCGISHKAILNFTGFSTAAIVLSANSVIQDFTLNHTDGLWFSAAADGAKALRIHGTADYATGGIVTSPQVAEAWFATTNGDIFYSTDAFSGTPTWHKVTAPEGISYFCVAPDGSAIYFSNSSHIYGCTNPKAGSPTWTLMFTVGSTVLGQTTSGTPLINVADQGKLYIGEYVTQAPFGAGVYGEAAGVGSISWYGTFTDWVNIIGANVVGVARDALIMSFGAGPQHADRARFTKTGVESTRYPCTYQGDTNFSAWRNTISDNVLALGGLVSQPNGWQNFTTGIFSPIWTNNSDWFGIITGAWAGSHYYCADGVGVLRYSADAVTWNTVATWGLGWVYDASWLGGGDLVWALKTVLDNGVPLRLYDQAGSIIRALTGNFWSLTSGNKTIAGAGLVYV